MKTGHYILLWYSIISFLFFGLAIIISLPSCYPKTSEYYYEKGKHYEAEGDYIHSVKELTKAIEKNPQYIEAYQKRAWLNFSQDSFAYAISDYTKIISLQPVKNNSEFIYLRGLAYYRSLQDSLACKDFYTSCELYGLNKSCDMLRKFCKK